ncbi:MAG: ferredoxin [Acidimicrobiales bacterium]
MGVEARVDRSRCIATKSCVYAAPGTFQLDEQRIAIVIDPAAEPLDVLIDAAENCPTAAISVFKDGEQVA